MEWTENDGPNSKKKNPKCPIDVTFNTVVGFSHNRCLHNQTLPSNVPVIETMDVFEITHTYTMYISVRHN